MFLCVCVYVCVKACNGHVSDRCVCVCVNGCNGLIHVSCVCVCVCV